MANKNIYPPILPSVEPSFINGTIPRIYFSIAPYMSIDDINKQIMQIIINDTVSHRNVVVPRKNNNSFILVAEIERDDNGYYFELDTSKLDLYYNNYYQIQARFLASSVDITPADFQASPSSYLNSLSEWSSVCLIKVIPQPKLQLNGFNNEVYKARTLVQSALLSLSGALSFSIVEESLMAASEDILQSYRIRFYEGDQYDVTTSSLLIHDSGILYPNVTVPNTFSYEIPYILLNQINYLIQIDYTTDGGYQGTETYYCMPDISQLTDNIDVEAVLEPNQTYGYNTITISPNDDFTIGNNLLLLIRKSNADSFRAIDILQYYSDTDLQNQIIYVDRLIQDGTQYMYQLLIQDGLKQRTVPKTILTTDNKDKAICSMEFISLIGSDTEYVNIKLNANISNFQHTVVESKTDTLGSQYPFIRRNGATDYRQFGITGQIATYWEEENPLEYMSENIRLNDSITREEDTNAVFLDHLKDLRSKILPLCQADGGENVDEKINKFYQEYYNNDFNVNKDIILERYYRDWVVQFLYRNSIRLFRSQTEGNILVKLMDITLTPNTTLGRAIYDFSATAYEIDEFTYNNCIKYNIHTINSYEDISDEAQLFKLGQIKNSNNPETSRYHESDIANNKIDIAADIKQSIQPINKQYVYDIDYFSWVRFNFGANPYLITIHETNKTYTAGGLKRHEVQYDIGETVAEGATNTIRMYGYLLEIDGVKIVVPPRGYYEIAGDGRQIKKIQLYVPSTSEIPEFTLDYEIKVVENYSQYQLKYRYLYYKIGQIHLQDTMWHLNHGINKPDDRYVNYIQDIVEDEQTINLMTQIQNDIAYTDTILKQNNGAIALKGLVSVGFEGQPYTKLYITDQSDVNPELHILNKTGHLLLNSDNTLITNIALQDQDSDKKYNSKFEGDESEIIYDQPLKDLVIDYVALVEGGIYS